MNVISKEEKEKRITQIVKTITANPHITEIEACQSIINEWGISKRQAYRYIEEANNILRKLSDKDLKREQGKILLQLDEIFANSFDKKHYHMCLGVIKQKCKILGLDNLNIHLPGMEDLIREKATPKERDDRINELLEKVSGIQKSA